MSYPTREYTTVYLHTLKPNKHNAKIHNEEQIKQIAESIYDLGYNDLISIDEDNVIIEGHGRFEALLLLAEQDPDKWEKIEVLRLCGFDEDKKRAYIHIHNKLCMNTGFDKGILDMELQDIMPNYDMSKFGFELPEPFELPEFGIEDGNEDEDGDDDFHRDNTYKAYNLEMVDLERVDGKYQMPMLAKTTYIPDDLIGFNYMKTYENKNVGVHCFVDDYQFERLWNTPYKYLDDIMQYDVILTPDFSLYMDMPIAMKLWNVFRSRLLGQFWQDCGIDIIPTVSWAEKETFDFAFDGIAKGSVVAVSTIGVKKGNSLKIWTAGMDAMIEKIKPSAILVYGGKVEYDYKGIEVRYYENKVTERLKATRKKGLVSE